MKTKNEQKIIQSGVYIIRYSSKTIKAGRAKNIPKRLKQYIGYNKRAKAFPNLLIIKSRQQNKLEKLVHTLLTSQYKRYGKYEIWKVTEQTEMITMIKNTLKNNELVHSFEE